MTIAFIAGTTAEIIKLAPVVRALEERGEDVVFFDGRNAYEAQVGKFKGAVVPNTDTTRDFLKELESDKYANIKDKPVVTYCTGGIRCEKAAIHMQNIGYEHVYQLEGGILKYFEEVGGAHYSGDCFVFDGRRTLAPDLSATGNAASARAAEDPDLARKS